MDAAQGERYPLTQLEASSDRPILFIHIPKTAGATLTALLASQYPGQVNQRRFWHDPAQPDYSISHASPASLRDTKVFAGHFYYDVGKILPEPPVRLIFLRHPVTRILSLYNYYRGFSGHPLHAQVKQLSFAEFADCDPGSPFYEATHDYVCHYLSCEFDISTPLDIQTAVPTTPPNRLELAQTRLAGCEFVGLTEKFGASLQLLAHTLGWDAIAPYQNINVTPAAGKLKVAEIPEDLLYTIIGNNAEDMILYDLALKMFQSHWAQYQSS